MTSLSTTSQASKTLISSQFVSTVLQLLSDGITRLQAGRTVDGNMTENAISQRLNDAMEEIYAGSDSDIVNFVLRPIRTIPGQPSQISEPDFTFHYLVIPRDNRKYLAAEAKKLRGTGRSLARAYVLCGVCRFVQGTYSLGHDYAVMLGYVVVSPLTRAITQVKNHMDSRSIRTAEQSAFSDASAAWHLPNTYSSQHLQATTTQPFTLLHLFADFS